jgi:hypothetical protein
VTWIEEGFVLTLPTVALTERPLMKAVYVMVLSAFTGTWSVPERTPGFGPVDGRVPGAGPISF